MSQVAIKKTMTDAQKRAALATLLQQKASRYPLSYGQLSMWFHQHLYPESSAYNIPLSFVLNGKIEDISLVQKSLAYVAKKNDALRTRFKFDGEEPSQYVEKDVDIVIPYRDFQEQAGDDWQKAVLLDSSVQANKAFDLEKDILFRAELLKISEDKYVLQFTIHHIVFDGWSIGVLLRDFAAAFVAYWDDIELPPVESRSSYKHFVLQQRKLLNSSRFAPKLDHWVQRLQGCNEAIDLPLDFPRPEKQTFAGKVYIEPVSRELADKMVSFSKQQNCTLFTFLLAGVYQLFGKISGQKDITIGVSQANRDDAQYRDLIGLFSQVLPMRGELDDKLSVADFVSQVQQQMLSDLENSCVPLSKILEALQIQRDPSRNMLFQVGFDYQNTPWPESLGELVSLLTGDAESSKLDINFNISKNQDGMLVIIEYNTDLFLESTIAHFASMFVHLLENSIANPEQMLGDVSLVNRDEQAALKACCFAEPLNHSLSDSVIHKIEEHALSQGWKPALSFDGGMLTYAQLYDKISGLAEALSQCGVIAGQPVVVDMPRSEQQIVSALAIMALGASYLPLDHAAPDHYKCQIMQDAQTRWVLRQDDHDFAVKDLHTVNVNNLTTENDSRVRQFNIATNHLAYFIYTSGSTGKPKGVMVTHDNLTTYCESACANYGIDANDKMLQFANLCFDTSVEEIFPTFWAGAELHLRPDDLHERLLDYFAYCQDNNITCVNFPTTYWHNLMDELEETEFRLSLPALKFAVVGGEAVRLDRVEIWQKVMPKHIRLLNTYGPSETTVAVTSARLDTLSRLDYASGIAPVGKPIPYCHVVIVDEAGNVLPRGVYGELLILGPTVSDGYYHNPDLTIERFGSRALLGKEQTPFFKSGDIGRYTLDGNIEFKGRRDNQIKNRGNRVELSHIEKLVNGMTGVKQTAVVQAQVAGSTQLVAWAIAEPEQEVNSKAILDDLRQLYADYLVPDYLLFIEKFPLTASGKINRVVLSKKTVAQNHTDAIVLPQSDAEKAVVDICRELLGITSFGVEANFFALGGHSLLLAKLIARLTKQFDVKIPVKAVYESRNLAELAHAIDAQTGEQVSEGIGGITCLPRAGDTQRFAPSSTQRRLWFLHQIDPLSTAYLIPKTFEITGNLDKEALLQAINVLVEKHEILRTRMVTIDGEPMQEVSRQLSVEMPIINLRPFTESERQQKLNELVIRESSTGLDIGKLPVFRCSLVVLDYKRFVFLFAVHHVLVDGISMAIMLSDLGAFYESLTHSNVPDVSQASVQFADFARWQNHYFNSDAYQHSMQFWQQYLQGAEPGLNLPYDRLLGDSQTHVAATHSSRLDSQTLSRLHALLQAAGGSMYTAMLGALNLCLTHYCDQRDIVVGTVVDGRDHPDVESTVGFFANTLFIRTLVDTKGTVKDLLRDSMQALVSVQEHRGVPFDDVINALGWSGGRTQGLLDVLFLYEKREPEYYEGKDIRFHSRPVTYHQTKVPLLLSVHEYEDHIELIWEYSVDLFDESTIDSLSQHFLHLVDCLASTPNLEKPLAALPLSQRQQMSLLHDEGSAIVSTSCVNSTLEQFAESDDIALVCGDQAYTYAALHKRSAQLAAWMIQQGMQPNQHVGLCLNRNVDLVVAILAAFKARLTYVPIDPHYPVSKITHLLEQTECSLMLAHADTMASLTAAHVNNVVALDNALIRSQLDEQSSWVTDKAVDPNRITHVIMTSGTTGTPKIVQIREDSVMALIEWAQSLYDYAEQRVLASTPVTFDLSVYELVVSLCSGATVVLVDSILDLVEQDCNVSLINTVPSAANTLLSHGAFPASCKTLNLAGEALAPQLVEDIFDTSGVEQVYNLYGPSEDTTYSTVARIGRDFDGGVPIGRPINGTLACILNQWQLPVPAGVTGELYLGGRGLSLGYKNQSDMTEQQFTHLHYVEKNQRFYRTGDQVRMDDAGELHFVGRNDHQVKLRGYRVELDEIRFALTRQPSVKDAAVIAVNDTLRAFVTPKQDNPDVIYSALAQLLPAYMLPNTLESMDELPLSAHGKIDINALKNQSPDTTALANVLPENATQKTLATLWQEVLPGPVEQVFIGDSFYQLGGHSLLMVRLFYRVKEQFSVHLSLIDLMQNLTVQAQSDLIDSKLCSVQASELERQEW